MAKAARKFPDVPRGPLALSELFPGRARELLRQLADFASSV